MLSVLPTIKKHASLLMKLLPLLAFAIPCLWLYVLFPESFQLMWKGRTFQLFFMWLISLELILDWENLGSSKIRKPMSKRAIAFLMTLLLPTIYILISNYGGLNTLIADSARKSGITWAESMPLSTEYLVFTAFFCTTVYLSSGTKGLRDFSVPAIFLGIIGAIYTIDNVFPYGQFTPLQFLVPTTTTFAAKILNLIGYNTRLLFNQDSPQLTAVDPNNPARSAQFTIAWPCAGFESLLIFAVVAAIFLRRRPVSWKTKTGYFAVGAAVTYFINILRIVTIFTIGMDYGQDSGPVQTFHFFYGPLYSVAWIVSFPLIVIGSQSLWQRIRNGKTLEQKTIVLEDQRANEQ